MENTTLRHSFALYDRDGDGYISVEELQETLRNLGYVSLTIQQLNTIIDEIGDSKSRTISFEQYCNLMHEPMQLPEQHKPVKRRVFKKRAVSPYPASLIIFDNATSSVHSCKLAVVKGGRYSSFFSRVGEWVKLSFLKLFRKNLGKSSIVPSDPTVAGDYISDSGAGSSIPAEIYDEEIEDEDEDETPELLLVFKALDANSDGVISLWELSSTIHKLGLSKVIHDDEVSRLMESTGAVQGHNPCITYPQFVELYRLCSEDYM